MIAKIMTAFIPIFFAIDVIGILPVFSTMTARVAHPKRKIVIRQAALTALLISICFIYFGKEVFHFLGITIPDFKIAGGILLLILSINDLLFPQTTRQRRDGFDSMGIVPIGMPLIIGPAVLTTLLLSVGTNGYNATLLALVLNVGLVWLLFSFSDKILRVIGEAAATAVGKVFSLLLAAIAVEMIRLGVTEMLTAFHS